MENRQSEKRISAYVPNLDASFDDLQKQLAAFIQAEREQLKARILKGENGFSACKIHAAMWDTVIQKVYEAASFQVRNEYQKQIDVLKQLPDIVISDLETELEEWMPDIALYGVGSYGRNELCYFSDVDVVYTSSVDLEDIYDESTLELVRWFYDFFDSLHSVIPGFEFSFIYRPLTDIAQWNYQDMAALIDMRFIAGNASLTERFRKEIYAGKSDISLVLDLLKSKADAFEASEDTIYLNQPNVKTGRGGLRTLQYALWICGLPDFTSIPELYERYDDEQLIPSLDFTFKVRNLLHVLADAPHDDLTYHPEKGDELQAQIARVLGFADETEEGRYAFMAAYYAMAKYLHFKAELLIRKMLANGIPVSEVLAVRTEMLYCIDNNFGELDANELFTLFTYFQQYDFEIDASLATFISRYVHAFDWHSFQHRMAELINMPGDVEKTLTRLHRLNILSHLGEGGELFEKAMMTRSERSLDPYTVGKHTLVAIGHLDEIRRTEPSSPFGAGGGFGSPIAPSPTSELEELNTAFRSLSDSAPLYMALFLHDIDKPDPTHPATGAEKAERIAPEFGFNAQQTDDICFLIREHLTMIALARYHHWDESTISEFCKKVNSLERLTALYLLTYCDSKANGSQNFSHVVKHNLKSLYEVVRTRFVGQEETQWGAFAPVEEFQQFLHHMPISYRISVSPEEIAMHIKMTSQVSEAVSTETGTTPSTGIIQFVDRPGFTELHLCSPSRIGKLHTVSGLFFANGIDVRDARVYTKQDTNIELEIYRLVHQPLHHRGEPMPLDEELKRDLDFDIRGLLAEEMTLEQVFERHYVNLAETWQVDDVSVETARNYSEIVVVGEEKVGFLHYFSGILAKLGLNVEMCKCSGLGGQAIDRFYVQPVADPKAVHADIMAALEKE
ncbi:HD domain-containing protein [Candidatus Poribacteria bacterium]|nr:HD domain-containing protein [Candidatus Poribacteria bacterium]MYA55520.1 HD domain-containing protein [Candidatus Poribacteria bacterium]